MKARAEYVDQVYITTTPGRREIYDTYDVKVPDEDVNVDNVDNVGVGEGAGLGVGLGEEGNSMVLDSSGSSGDSGPTLIPQSTVSDMTIHGASNSNTSDNTSGNGLGLGLGKSIDANGASSDPTDTDNGTDTNHNSNPNIESVSVSVAVVGEAGMSIGSKSSRKTEN